MSNEEKGSHPEKHWGFCPACYRERRTLLHGAIRNHRRYVGGKMVPCEGSGQQPFVYRHNKEEEKTNG